MSKIKHPEELWDRYQRKLLVYVMEGVSLVTKSGAGNPYVKLTYNKQRVKTDAVKHSEDPTWKQLFLFEALPNETKIEIEVYTKQTAMDKLIGQCTVDVPFDRPDEVHDVWVDLQLPQNVSQKTKDILDNKIGNIHIRLCVSFTKETPGYAPDNSAFEFFYDDYKKQFKTGDLIVYNGIGTIDAITKIISNSKYSRLGMIIKYPNKWTKKEKLYVFEVTRNVGLMQDAFTERCHGGPCLFRLFERIHAVNATHVYWVPLKEPLDPSAGEQNMKDYIWELHEGRERLPELPVPPEEVLKFFGEYEMNLESSKHANVLAEFNAAFIIANALRLGGKRINFERHCIPPVQLMAMNLFNEPVVLRVKKDVTQQGLRKSSSFREQTTTDMPSVGGRAASSPSITPSYSTTPSHTSGSPTTSASASPIVSHNGIKVAESVESVTQCEPSLPPSSGAITTSEDSASVLGPSTSFSERPKSVITTPITTTSSKTPSSRGTSKRNRAQTEAPSPKKRSKNAHGVDSSDSPVITRDSSPLAPESISGSSSEFESSVKPQSKSSKKKKATDSSKRKHTKSHSSKGSQQLSQSQSDDKYYTTTVAHDFEALNPGELTVSKGCIVTVLDDTSDAEWALVRIEETGSSGCVPKSYLKRPL